MGRTKTFDEDRAVSAAMTVFWRLGFEGTSLPDLLHAMKLSRSSMYATFGSKEALFERCVEAYSDELVGALYAELGKATSGRAFIRDVLLSVADEPARSRGCLVMNSASELGQRVPHLAQLIGRQVHRFEAVFEAALQREEPLGARSQPKDRRALAKYLVCSLSGLKTMAKAGSSRESLSATSEIVLQQLAQ